MNRFGALSIRRSPAARVLLMVLPLIALALVTGAAGSRAAATDAPPATRDHGYGHWFRHVCSLPNVHMAWCGAQVVTNADGQPLASSSPPSSALTPAGFHSAYSLPTVSVAGTPTIAIVDAFDDPNIESDLAAFDTQFGLPPCTTANGCFQKVDQNGGTSYPTGTSWHLEIALDVEIAHAMCQNCKILLVEAASNSLANLGTAVNRAVAMGANVVSNSYGGGEFSSETSYETSYYKHPGVAITASSGDSGYGVEFPAASQYVTAVGGTTLSLNADKTYKSETIWSGSGSGCSLYEPKPAWQTDAGCSRRTVADVSADADPNSGAAIFDSVGTTNGQGWYQVGGTSLAAPLIGAVYALTGNTSVNYGSIPYGQPALLNDVLSGSNGTCTPAYLCTGGAGFDGPSGLGTPHGLGAFGGSAPAPDFALSVSPASRTVTQGSPATYPVTITPSNGFGGSVTLGATGLPGGASASFSPNPATSSSTLTVTTTASLAPGTYPFTITGTSGSLSHSAAATLVVQAAPDFSLTASPSSRTVAQGAQTTFAIQITPAGGFAGSVTLAASGLPAGATASFSPNPAPATGSTLTVSTTASVAPGSYPFTVTGTSGSLSHSAGATLVVQAVPAPDFSLSAPGSQTVTAGGQATYALTITPVNGFVGTVSLAASSLPAGATASFSPNPATASSTLTVSTTAGVTAGSYPFTITGTSGSLSHSAAATLVVQAAAAPDFALGVSPSSRTVVQGSSTTYTVAITPSNGFAGATAGYSPNPATSGSTLTITTTASLAPGSYPFTITGTSGSLSHAAGATLVVQGAPDFSLGISPSSQTVTAGGQTTYTLTLTASNGFAGSVTLAAGGLPAGAAASFDPNPPTTTSTLTITTVSSLPAAAYPFTVTGTSGSLSHSLAATLVVQAAPVATLGVSPTSAPRGTSVTVTWSGVASPTSTDWIGIFKPGASNTSYLSRIYDSTCKAARTGSPRSAGSCSFKLPKKAGTYELRLLANNGFTAIVTGVTVVST
jgi:uncharacterized membrane protein